MQRLVPAALLAAHALFAAVPASSQALYWESPSVVAAQAARWSTSAAGGGRIVLAWEEIVPASAGSKDGSIWLSAAFSTDGASWSYAKRLLGPVRYSGVDPGSEPQLYSLAVGPDGTAWIAALTAEKEVTVLSSAPGTTSFQVLSRAATPASAASPSLFITARGSLLFFASLATGAGSGQSPAALWWSSSETGRQWEAFAPFVTAGPTASGVSLQPDHASTATTEVVAFQAESAGATGFQVYTSASRDGGRTWGTPRPMTTGEAFAERVGTLTYAPEDFSNVRPRISASRTGLALVWERSLAGTGTASAGLYGLSLDAEGAANGAPEPYTPSGTGRFGQMLSVGTRTLLVYSREGAGGTSIRIAEKTGSTWTSTPIGRMLGGSGQYPHAVVFGGSPFIFWENLPPKAKDAERSTLSALVGVRPKRDVTSPALVAVGFTPGKPERSDNATVRWSAPADPVGIDSYEVTLRHDGAVAALRAVAADPNAPVVSFPWTFSADGTWRFEVVAIDIPGNRSKPATVDFVRDTSPPPAVAVAAPAADPDGFLPSNTFTVTWSVASATDVAGYAWEQQLLAASPGDYALAPPAIRPPAARVMTTDSSRQFLNLEDGVYAVSVRAVDAAGNAGPVSSVIVFLDKFRPYTIVYAVSRALDDIGNVLLSVRGRGFTSNGAISEIYLSRSDRAPYDRVLKPGERGVRVVSDSLITGLVLDDSFAPGTYRVGLLQAGHDPWFTSTAAVRFDPPGTVRLGSFAVRLPRWLAGPSPRWSVSFSVVLVLLVLSMFAVVAFWSAGRLAALAQEGAVLRTQVVALLEGRPSAGWAERNRRMQELKRRGVSLRLKFITLLVVIVTIVVLIVSIPLSVQAIATRGESLAAELKKRTDIVISTMASTAPEAFKLGREGGGDITGRLPATISQINEATYATITGPSQAGSDRNSREYVWASNADKYAEAYRDKSFQIGETAENDALSAAVPSLQQAVNDAAPASLAKELGDYRGLKARIDELNAKTRRTPAETRELADGFKTIQLQVAAIDQAARNFPETAVRSEPAFDPTRLAPTYLFYKPIVYFKAADGTFYQGLVRMEVRTEKITEQIVEGRNALIRSTALIAILAIGLGVVGAFIMARITITPIRKLAKGVSVIGETEDKELLKDHLIVVRSRDEIGQLADTVNAMTRGLVKAAVANKELMIGKDIQKMFLPLESDGGRKGTMAVEDTQKVEIAGYYEGAKGVSGDYFDYRRLDDVHYAIIKCDVAGKGVSAALIMVEVATLFASYFRDWQKRREAAGAVRDAAARTRAAKELTNVEPLVYTINDMLEERGFKGRFAALTIAILNAETGAVNVCNAGDTKLHLYRRSEGKMVKRDLPNAPAAGVFPSMLVEMKSGFRQVPERLAPGDALFLFTDGFEEAKHSFHDAAGEVHACEEPGLEKGADHGTHKVGETSEEFGIGRIEGVVNAVFSRGRYRLERAHAPAGGEELTFDFSTCTGTLREAVIALVAVEKVFRLVADPRAGDKDVVNVEPRLDAFLRDHFVQYKGWFAHRTEPETPLSPVSFTRMREDEQYDDLTIIVIKKK